MSSKRIYLPRLKVKKQRLAGTIDETPAIHPRYLEQTARRDGPVQRFCLPPWEARHLWLAGWQAMIESRTPGGLLEGTAFRLKPVTVPVAMAVNRMSQEQP